MLAVEDGRVSGEGTEPLLLLAVNGTLEADWDTMRTKACCTCVGELALSDVTGTQAGDVSRAVCEQASGDDGGDGDGPAEWQQVSNTEHGDVAWTGV